MVYTGFDACTAVPIRIVAVSPWYSSKLRIHDVRWKLKKDYVPDIILFEEMVGGHLCTRYNRKAVCTLFTGDHRK